MRKLITLINFKAAAYHIAHSEFIDSKYLSACSLSQGTINFISNCCRYSSYLCEYTLCIVSTKRRTLKDIVKCVYRRHQELREIKYLGNKVLSAKSFADVLQVWFYTLPRLKLLQTVLSFTPFRSCFVLM